MGQYWCFKTQYKQVTEWVVHVQFTWMNDAKHWLYMYKFVMLPTMTNINWHSVYQEETEKNKECKCDVGKQVSQRRQTKR